MSLFKRIAFAAVPLSLLALGGCAQPFSANVARFQQLPVPQGQTFTIQAANPRNQGGVEFAQYASLVAQRLTAQGYAPANNANSANLLVTLDYGVDTGKEKIVSYPSGFGGGFGYGGFGGRGFGYGGYGRYGGFGRYGGAFSYGWNDPFWGWGGGSDVESYTYFTSFLDMTINRTANGERVFEGKARARSRTDSLPALVPNLVEAMFTNFPGRSGEEVKITIPGPPRRG